MAGFSPAQVREMSFYDFKMAFAGWVKTLPRDDKAKKKKLTIEQTEQFLKESGVWYEGYWDEN